MNTEYNSIRSTRFRYSTLCAAARAGLDVGIVVIEAHFLASTATLYDVDADEHNSNLAVARSVCPDVVVPDSRFVNEKKNRIAFAS
jgi:hypothetical protein